MSNTRLALCEVRGPLNQLLENLSGDDHEVWLKAFKRFLRKENPWKHFGLPSAHPFTSHPHREVRARDHEIVEGLDEPSPIEISQLELVDPFESGMIFGLDSLIHYACELQANLGLKQAEYMLVHQDQIPEDFGRYELAFTRTIWEDSCGMKECLFLHRFNKRWYPRLRLLNGPVSSFVRLVRLRRRDKAKERRALLLDLA